VPALRGEGRDDGAARRVTPVDFRPLGLMVGHATDAEGGTGLTIVRHAERAWRGGAAVLGRATGTRELAAVSPSSLADRVDAVMLTGGSAYGLDAAAGAMRWMEERGRGFSIGTGVVPIVPAAVIFDLMPAGRPDARPTSDMAYMACGTATSTGIAEGSVGAGTGATVGKAAGREGAMKGGVGCWIESVDGLAVGAVVVVNAFGDVRDADGKILAGARDAQGRFVDSARFLAHGPAPRAEDDAGRNTTLAVIATNAALSRTSVQELAAASGAALHRRITPAGTSFDGDVIFTLCAHEGIAVPAIQVEALAVRVLEMAIERAVRLAVGRDGVAGLADS
jgi:L-aminopeptidase/D-esterase-like protein